MPRSFLLALCTFAVSLAACGGQTADPAVVKFGVGGPMTGDQAKNGEELWYGASLAAEEWNGKGGLLGRKIVLIQKDDQADEKEAVKVASEFIDAGVTGVIGHYNSGVTFPASKEYRKRKILMITPAATNPVITDNAAAEGFRTVFRLCGRDDVQGRTGAEFCAKTLKLERVAALHDKTIYGEGLASAFKQAAEEFGLTVTAFEGFENREMNFRPYFPKLKDGEPQLWYFGGIHNQGGPIARQAKENGIEIPFMSGDGVFHNEFLAKAGDKAEGAFFTFPDVYSSPEAKSFAERYEARFNRKVGPYSVYAYAAASILFSGIAKAGTTDGNAAAEAIRGMEHATVFGPVSFDEKGDVKGSFYKVWTVRNGKFVLYEETK